MRKATIALTFPDCVNRGDGPCEAWRGMAEQWKSGVAQYDELRNKHAIACNSVELQKDHLRELRQKLATLRGTEAYRVEFLNDAIAIFEAIGDRVFYEERQGRPTNITKQITGEELETIYKLVRCAHGGYPIVCQSSSDHSPKTE